MASIFSFSLHVPYLEFSACKTSKGVGRGGCDSISSSPAFFVFLDLISIGILIPRAGHPCVGQLFHKKYHGLSV